jgi:ABC-type dipeptide/oligopeptide/nickel transport system ATPase component
MSNRILSIQLNNFKFFQEEEPIELKGNNLLLYGENGSGKSSIYWAFYTLFEASLKSEDDEIKKYFSKAIKPKDNLINIHSKETAEGSDDYNSFIELLTTDNPPLKYRVSKTDVAINKNDAAKFINYASDYINYRMLLSISGFRHSDEIDLFWMFVEDIFKYVQFSKVQISREGKLKEITNAFEIWQEIEKGNEWVDNVGEEEKIDIEKYKATSEWKQFDDLVKSFNKSLNNLVDTINNISPVYFKKLGYDFTFNLVLKSETSYKEDLRDYDFIPFKLALEIPEYEKEKDALHKPHSFLNEAKLSAMAISIRLAILSEKRLENCLKFIVLDDLLISLDMRNREKVLELLLSADFIDNYQIIILTHDRMFYQMAKHKIDILEQENWKYIEMYETKDELGNSKPHIKSSKTYLEKAEDFYKHNNLPEAANNLRKAGEEFCKKILSKKQTISEDYSDFDLSGMIEHCLNFSVMNDLQHKYFNQLDKFRKFLLNSGSHDDYDTPMFKSEINDCIKIFKIYFNKIKLKHILPEGTVLVFELVDSKKPETYKFEITLKENLRIYKEPAKEICVLRVKTTYLMYKDGDLKATEDKQISLKDFYEKIYSTSDGKKDKNYLKEVFIKSTNQPLETIVKF